ncbi:helix-turn-helix transcriptional regulator [Actinomadura rugatobispora]|uniref:AAA family ATPase n=1 Tax=Actinomadura rugatobispora TaxID=1994 RepID=A0ABW0ZX58_9ACTN|nr:LuxR family transcriptional regulator [Actinomadura rugatobispora]
MHLVERDKEFDALTEAFRECAHNGGRLILVNGPPGSGKSALLDQFCERVGAAGGRSRSAVGRKVEMGQRLGIVERLFRVPDASAEMLDALDRALTAIAEQDAGHDLAQRPPSHEITRLAAALRRDISGSPLVICVDDVQYADAASLQVLSLLMGRLDELPLLLVVTEPGGTPAPPISFQIEARRVRRVRRLRLGPLSRSGALEVLAGRVGGPAAARLADRFYEITGGNPLLVGSLAEECGELAPPADPDWGCLATGERFTSAVLVCTGSGDADTFWIACCVAVLGDEATVGRVARLAGAHRSAAAAVIRELTSAGLVAEVRFRSPEPAAALLARLPPADVSVLHTRAAHLLYEAGLPFTAVARHLVGEEAVGEPWVVRVMLEAAAEARERDDVGFAVTCLDAAARACSTDAERVPVEMARRLVDYRDSPLLAHRWTESLLAAMRAGHLSQGDIAQLVMDLAWQGRLADAKEALSRAGEAESGPGARGRTTSVIAHELFELLYPPERGATGRPAGPVSDHRAMVVRTLSAVLANGGDDQSTSLATSFLGGMELNEHTISTIVSALHILIFGGRPDMALPYCDAWYEEAVARGSRTWQGLLAWTRASIAMHQGDHVVADRRGRDAFAAIPPAGWGVVVAAPLAACVSGSVALGRTGDAAKWLSTPVPDALFQSRFGPQYQYAWGEYHLATDRPDAALEDFLACGEQLGKWNMDIPSVLPWRIAAAEACLALGDAAQARQIIDGHDRRSCVNPPRIRAAFLRVLSMTKPLKERPALLQEALTALAGGADRSEAIRVLADLGQVLADLGMSGRARSIARRAWNMARDEGLEALCAPRLSPSLSAHLEVSDDVDMEGQISLSESELAVAKLAALEHTNREISRKLNITVSTVEQHLTRVYKKLGARGRHEISILLQMNAATVAVRSE